MDTACLEHCLTEDERTKFERDGFMVVEDALPASMVADLTKAVDRVKPGVDFIGKDDRFLGLIDCPTTLPKVWGILGWNIHLYHTHITITPPVPLEERPAKKRLHWHQDSGRVSLDIETIPAPRISVKVGYFLTDVSEGGRGNFSVIPGSHLKDEVEYPADGVSNPEDAFEVRVPAGSAAIFDRRIWHAGGWNFSDITRKVLFVGYSHRWFHPRDAMTVSHYVDRCDPIRRQLLGSKTGNLGLTTPKDEDVPLRNWIREHLGEEAIADRSVRNLT
ncbi:MAG: phytanoyl-CoA dioxygenase family protein [Candidatus Poribacteria bacterium]|nr:phytanoyl-CoA dioxygenase family protein [Candidatus Poribacteria bacterium]